MFLLPFLLNRVVLIILSSLVIGSVTAYGGIKANDYLHTQMLLQEAKQLSSQGKYQDAISKLITTEDKWSPSGTKEEIKRLTEYNKRLEESSRNYDLGKDLFDKEKYKDALEILKKVDNRNINYSSARSLVELAEKKTTDTSIGEVAGVSSKVETKIKSNVSVETPIPSPPTPTPSPQPSVDWGKVAELKNILESFKRQANIMVQAEFQIKFNQDGLSACLRGVEQTIKDAPIVEGSKLTFSPAQQDEMRNNCTNLYKPEISRQTSIYNAALSQIQSGKDRANILTAECPKCWEEAQK